MIGFGLGLKAAWRDPAALLIAALGLAASLAPILIVWGLKSGLVTALLDQLRSNPSNLAIVFRGDGIVPIGDPEIERLRALPGAAFVEPMTRTLTLRAKLEAPASGALITADLLPTGPGEPLLAAGDRPPGAGEMALSAGLAAKLGARSGTQVRLSAERRTDAGIEMLDYAFAVAAIIPAAMDGRDTAYLPFAVLNEIEAFRDGYAVRDFMGRPLTERPRAYGSVRFYARSLEDVEPLDAALTGMGFAVTSQAHRVREILALDRNLATAFLFIAGAAAIGFGIAFVAAMAATLARLRRHLSLVRLIGAPKGTMILFPLAQAAIIAALGLVLAIGAYQFAALAINRAFAGDLGGADICVVPARDLGIAAAVTVLIAGLAAVVAGLRYASVAPAEVLHAE